MPTILILGQDVTTVDYSNPALVAQLTGKRYDDVIIGAGVRNPPPRCRYSRPC